MRTSSIVRSSLILLLAFGAACRGTIDRRVDPDMADPVGGANLRSQDIRSMADAMARDIKAFGVLKNAPQGESVRFFTTGLVNESSDPINSTIITTKLRTNLFNAFGGQVEILDRSPEALELIKSERAAKRSGAVEGNPSKQGNVLGADYVLKGRIQDRVLQSSDRKSAYYLVTFELTDLETSRLMWTGDYEAKFDSEKSVIAR